jgi:hypothetical protein
VINYASYAGIKAKPQKIVLNEKKILTPYK